MYTITVTEKAVRNSSACSVSRVSYWKHISREDLYPNHNNW